MRCRVARAAKKSVLLFLVLSSALKTTHPVRDVYLELLCSHVVPAKYGPTRRLLSSHD